MRTYNSTGVTSRGPTEADGPDIDFIPSAMPQITDPGMETPYVVDDANLVEHVGATYYNDYYNVLTIPDDYVRDRLAYESLDPDIATISSSGTDITRVSDGVARILMKHPNRIIRHDVDVSIVVPGTVHTFDSYVAGSLAHEMSNAIDSRISGKTPSTAKPLFTTQDHDTPNYVRNPDCWVADLDLTCISPWNSTGGTRRAGTLVSPRHIVFARHYKIAVGATVRFVKMDGTVVDRTMTARRDIEPGESWPTVKHDVTVGLLDSDVPAGINFCKFLPTDVSSYLPSLYPAQFDIPFTIPCLCLDQEEEALILDSYFWDSGEYRMHFKNPIDETRLSFFEDIIVGDSGNPAFLIIDDELVLTTTWTEADNNSASGPFMNGDNVQSKINAAMTSLGGGYQLTVKDLSAYPTY